MRKVTVFNRISVDGHFASLNEETFGMDWFVPDPEVDRAVRSGDGKVDTLLLGATTFAGFERSWTPLLSDANAPKELKAVAEELTRLNKIVFTSRRVHSDWANTRFVADDPADTVRKLKASDGDGILIMGSGSIVRQLANERLIDEFLLVVTPVVAGIGKPLFPDIGRLDLTLMRARSFASGNVLLHYKLKG